MRKFVMTMAMAAVLAACGDSSSRVEIDATDGITLDGTFREAVADLGEADQLKAAAGLLMLAYEGDGDEGQPLDYIQEAKNEASFLLDPTAGDGFFQSRGEVMEEIARGSNGALDGKTAQELIDVYNLRTGQFDEYLKDQQEAEAAAEREAAAKAEAERIAAIAARKTELRDMLSGLDTAKQANAAKLAELKRARDAAQAIRDKADARAKAMAGDIEPASGMKMLGSSGRFSGQVIVTVVNTTDAPIQNPVVMVGAAPQGQPGNVTWALKASGPYKFEDKNKTIAPGESRDVTYPINVFFEAGSALAASTPVLTSYLDSYETAAGKKVSLLPSAAQMAPIKAHADAVARCAAADTVLAQARTTIPAALDALDRDGADPAEVGKIGAVRC